MEHKHAVIFYDLVTRDGRLAVEVRTTFEISNCEIASPKSTIYSCAYHDQIGRKAACARAADFCRTQNLAIVQCVGPSADNPKPRATWQ